MKDILFISNYINPFEPTYGGAQRSNLLLKACLKVGQVDFVMFQNGVKSNLKGCDVVFSKEMERSDISRLKKWAGLLTPWNPYSIYRIHSGKEKVIDELMKKKRYDYIVIRYIPEALTCGLLKYADRLIVDVDDNPKDTLRNNAKLTKSKPNKLYNYIASLWAPVFVKRVTHMVHAALFSNPQQVKGAHEVFLPNVAFEEPQSEYVCFKETKPRLFFVGRLDYYPNYLGIDHFVESVWPEVLKALPKAELQIAGKVYAPEVVAPYFAKWNQTQGIKVLGFLESLDASYAACRATISPIFLGAGTNIKLVESMQRKRVCITTDCGMRGMSSFIQNWNEVLVSSNAKEFASLCIKALSDEAFNHQIAKNAYEAYTKSFAHEAFNKIVGQIMTK